jgi:hypothetical protein
MTATKKMVQNVFFTLLVSLVCSAHGALADELATPTPTPAHLTPLRRGALRRAEWVDRRRTVQSEVQSNAHARAQAKASRSSTAAQKAETKEAAHARAQAQRELTAEARHESAKEIRHTNSDVMARMGFSEEEVAAQKAREQSGQLGKKEMRNGIAGADHQEQAPAGPTSSAAADPAPAAQTPTTSGTVPNPNSP